MTKAAKIAAMETASRIVREKSITSSNADALQLYAEICARYAFQLHPELRPPNA